MSGHSKWHSIKHQKAAADQKRGKVFTKLAAEIAVAAREGTDPKMNYKLRLAVTKARQNAMPADNIDRAIARGSGQAGGAALEELTYEGYGPSGVALLVHTVTDNRNRTAAEVKSIFSKYHGNLGAPGSVAYLFEQRGVLVVGEDADRDEVELAAIDAGASDIDDTGEQLLIYTAPHDLERVKDVIASSAGEDKVTNSELEMIAQQQVRVEDPAKATSILKMIDALDALEDVIAVDANYDIPDDILAQISA